MNGGMACFPEICNADQRVRDNTCVACPVGTTNDAGDEATGDDTQCDQPPGELGDARDTANNLDCSPGLTCQDERCLIPLGGACESNLASQKHVGRMSVDPWRVGR